MKRNRQRARGVVATPASASPSAARPAARGGRSRLALAALCGLTLLIYARLLTADFVGMDDAVYVTENLQVQAGLSWANVRWALHATEGSNCWHPLTWLAHMLDVQLYGLKPGGHHLSSVLLHLLNTVCLYGAMTVLVRTGARHGRWQEGGRDDFVFGATDARWPALGVAVLFALHPLHVEAVAWIGQRKELLCTFFTLLALWSYGRYAREAVVEEPDLLNNQERATRNPLRWYVFTLLFFVGGLMAKPMIITLPFLLLLLDYWPLGRVRWERSVRLLVEKVPFFLLAIVAAGAAVRNEAQGSTLISMEAIPLTARILNAGVAYATYCRQTFWPTGLACFYPHLGEAVSGWAAGGAFVFLGAVTALAVWSWRRYPFRLVGWFWFLGTLFPVIGVVETWSVSRADRYTYWPLTGVFLVMVWEVTMWRERRRVRTAPGRRGAGRAGAVLAGVSLGALLVVGSALTWRQVAYWQDGVSLFQRALAVTENNWVAHGNLGVLFAGAGRYPEALTHYRQALSLQPRQPEVLVSLGRLLMQLGRPQEAVGVLREAPAHGALSGMVALALAQALAMSGDFAEALAVLDDVLAAEPEDAAALAARGSCLLALGRAPEAADQYRAALRRRADDPQTRYNLGLALATMGHHADAAVEIGAARDQAMAAGRTDLAQAMAATLGLLEDAAASAEREGGAVGR